MRPRQLELPGKGKLTANKRCTGLLKLAIDLNRLVPTFDSEKPMQLTSPDCVGELE